MMKSKVDPKRLEAIQRSANAAMAVLSKAGRDESSALERLLNAKDAASKMRNASVHWRDAAKHEKDLAELDATIAKLTREHAAAVKVHKEAEAAQQEAQTLLRACKDYSEGL